MPWAYAATVAAAAIGAGGSLMASGQQADSAQNAINTQSGIYNTTRNDLATYNQTGQGAVNQLASYWGIGNGGLSGGYGAAPQTTGAAPGAQSAQPQTPGMIAALGTKLKSGRDLGNLAVTSFLNPAGVGASLLGLKDPLSSAMGLGNNSALQDIKQALQLGRPISDASWAKAGYGPNGVALGGSPQFQLPTIPLSQANPTIAPPGTNGPAPSPNANNAFSQLQNYPGYQFQYDQGLQALNRNLSAGGRYTSGAMMKDAQAYGQGFAQNSVTSYLDMLKFLGTLGQNSAAQTGSAGALAGQGIASSQMNQGTAAAAGTMGAANALGGLAQNQSFQNLFGGSNSYTNASGGMFNGNYLAPFNSGAAAAGF